MPSWPELGEDSFLAAKSLLNSRHYRSACSRAYYAAYAMLTAEFRKSKGVRFTHGDHNPSHDQLRALVINNLAPTRFSIEVRRQAKRIVSHLIRTRLVADYEPGGLANRQVALMSVRQAAWVRKMLESA